MERHPAAEYGPHSPRAAHDHSLWEAAMKYSIGSASLIAILGIVTALIAPPPH